MKKLGPKADERLVYDRPAAHQGLGNLITGVMGSYICARSSAMCGTLSCHSHVLEAQTSEQEDMTGRHVMCHDREVQHLMGAERSSRFLRDSPKGVPRRSDNAGET